jgi:hypothetical protein
MGCAADGYRVEGNKKGGSKWDRSLFQDLLLRLEGKGNINVSVFSAANATGQACAETQVIRTYDFPVFTFVSRCCDRDGTHYVSTADAPLVFMLVGIPCSANS